MLCQQQMTDNQNVRMLRSNTCGSSNGRGRLNFQSGPSSNNMQQTMSGGTSQSRGSLVRRGEMSWRGGTRAQLRETWRAPGANLV